MTKNKLFFLLGLFCIVASIVMYFLGKESSHLSELKDYWWIPLPPGALALLAANKK